MSISIVDCQGNIIRELEGRELQVNNSLEKWCNRLNKWEYTKQLKQNKGKRLKQFYPNSVSLELSDIIHNMINEKCTPEEAMSVLHRVDIRTELNICMEAGF